MKTTLSISIVLCGLLSILGLLILSQKPQPTNDLHHSEFSISNYEFYKFIAKYGKKYSTKEEMNKRANVFQHNINHIHKSNAINGRTYTLGINKFTDMTNEEFRKSLGRKVSSFREAANFTYLNELGIPDKWDWRTKGAVNPI